MYTKTVLTPVGVGDVCTLSVVAPEAPGVEGTLQTVALDPPSGPQVGSHVRTVGIQCVRHAPLVPKHRQIHTCHVQGENTFQSEIGLTIQGPLFELHLVHIHTQNRHESIAITDPRSKTLDTRQK